MKETYGKMEIDEAQLKAADPDGLYLFMLEQYPYMMTPDNVPAFTGTTGQEIRKLLNKGTQNCPPCCLPAAACRPRPPCCLPPQVVMIP